MKTSSLSARKTVRYCMLYALLCSCCALGLRVATKILYSSTRNRRSVSTVTVWTGIRTLFIP